MALLAPVAGLAEDLGAIRVGVLQFGTVNWELDVIEHHGLDHKHGFTLVVQGFGSDQATDVARYRVARSTRSSATGSGSRGNALPDRC